MYLFCISCKYIVATIKVPTLIYQTVPHICIHTEHAIVKQIYICCNLRGNRWKVHTVIFWNVTPLQTPQTQWFTNICSNMVHPILSLMYEQDSLEVTLKPTAKSILSFEWWKSNMLLKKIKAATCHMLLHLSKISLLWWQT